MPSNKLWVPLLTFSLVATSLFSTASAEKETILPISNIQPTPPDVAAKGYFLVDANTGAVLASKNPEEHLEPASLTKLMTLYLTFQALKSGQLQLSDKITISNEAWKMQGSRMFLRPNTEVSIDDLLKGVIVDSGNDACEALAEQIGGNSADFAVMMNQEAQKLGMNDSHFENSTGLPQENHYSSAKDLAKLSAAIATQFPNYYPYFSQKWFTYNDIKQPNRNRLLWRDNSVDGLKTGHTDSAGYCLVASAKRDKTRLIAVVMGTQSDAARADVSLRLLNYGFHFYKTYELFNAQTPLSHTRVWMGQLKNVNLGLEKPLAVTIRIGDYSQLQAHMNIEPKIKAPILKGQQLGEVVIMLHGNRIAQAPLVAMEANKKGSWLSQLIDSIALGIKHIL